MKPIPKFTKEEAYQAGYDCGINGATTGNCHFSYFATKELMETHSQGVKDAKKFLSELKTY